MPSKLSLFLDLHIFKIKAEKKMKKQLFSISLSAILLLSGMSVFAQTTYQCDLPNSTPIQCGYYQEGYQDGQNDAQSNRNSDYRRYRNKLDGNKYESVYRQGYDAGFSSSNSGSRWNFQQRNAYDRGYNQGQSDQRMNRQRNNNQWNQSLKEYFDQGYWDGYDGRNRQYDVPLYNPTNPTNPGFPGFPGGGGSQSGSLTWSGRVDDRVNIIIKGRDVRTQTIAGTNPTGVSQNMSGALPNRSANISVNKRNGRGEVTVIQQPNRSNNFTAIIQVYDPRGGADNYSLDVSWQSNAPVEEPYQSGRITWRGRVDQTANIIVSGNSVETQDVTGTGLSGVSHNITGYLAYRPGSVNVRKIRGRGTVSILQQPNASNDYVAIIQVFDPERAAGDYEVEISW